jgi:hypothetical protein
VTTADVAKVAGDSPQHTVLVWAQAVQFSDPRTVIGTYLPKAVARAGPTRITQAVRAIGQSLGRPEFLQTTLAGARRARIRAFMVSYDSARRPVLRQPVTFDLVRPDATWLLEDTSLLMDTYADLEHAKQAGGGSG